MHRAISVTSGTHDVDRHIEYFKKEAFSDDDKLSLLNFLTQEFGLKNPLVLGGGASSVSMQFLVEQSIRQQGKIDLLYLDSKALRDGATLQIEQLWGKISRKGVVCLEYAAAGETTNAGEPPGREFEPVLISKGFSVFARVDGERPLYSMRYQVDLFLRRRYLEHRRIVNSETGVHMPEVAVVVLTYKHEGYIDECLRSVLNQRGHFRMRVIIIDDASPDETAKIVAALIAENRDDRIEINFQTNAQNVGVVVNLATAISLAAGCDYLTFCEGDDFWISNLRIQKHINFLIEHPDSILSFNSIELCDANGGSRTLLEVNESCESLEIEGYRLAENNFIGNFTACFYRGEMIDVIPHQLFEIYTVDWFFNLYCSQFGKIGHLREVLSIYRQHSGGEWSSRKSIDKAALLITLIGQYDAFLDYLYDKSFQKYTNRIYGTIDHAYEGKEGRLDLIVLDDVFPSGKSGSRYSEFTSYLREFKKSLVLSSGKNIHVVEKKGVSHIVRAYRRRHLNFGCRVFQHDGGFPLRLANLVYLNFLNNVYSHLLEIELARVPFVFTLYPGGGFVLNNPECDRKLKRVFDSPCFQRVIVTQQVSYDYIVERGLCPVKNIQMIFGVVMPEISMAHDISSKRRWGFGKPRLDICFMAHRYTTNGEDKGYDVFLNIASILRQRHEDIYFHVVGPFESTFSDRIKFHGSLDVEQFESFFQDMDIILSPNISGKISPGSFDGFPTASCTEAGLRGTAIFAVDEFNSAAGRFTDGQDVVLINYDLDDIVNKIEKYYSNPVALKSVGENGSRRICDMYSYEAQMAPRIALLRSVINNPVVKEVVQTPLVSGALPREDDNAFDHNQPSLLWTVLQRFCPVLLKRLYRSWRGNHAI